MKQLIHILSILLVGTILAAGCTSNQDEELKTTFYDSSRSMVIVLESVGRDASSLDFAGLMQSGRALETESKIWYDKISAINDISPEWRPVRTHYLNALNHFSNAGRKASDASLAFQQGDYSSSITLMEQASADMISGNRYLDEAMAAIPKN